jgi:pyruvate/2-oxoglutarate dehydrogenase complex dihydrolipoamide acyltransferase (E2) component
MISVFVPDLGDGIKSVDVVAWLSVEGAAVVQGQDLVEVVTDKAAFNVAAPVSGVLTRICCPAGGSAEVGSLLGEIDAGMGRDET